jgi:hypothetical protein
MESRFSSSLRRVCPSRGGSNPASAGDREHCGQWHGSHDFGPGPRARAHRSHATRSIRPAIGSGRGRRRWHRARESQPSFRRIPHDQARRLGHGPRDLPLDRRGSRWAIMGRCERAPRHDLSLHGSRSCSFRSSPVGRSNSLHSVCRLGSLLLNAQARFDHEQTVRIMVDLQTVRSGQGLISMTKPRLRLVPPAIVNRTVLPTRRPNRDPRAPDAQRGRAAHRRHQRQPLGPQGRHNDPPGLPARPTGVGAA